jgi:hypothetical protein
MAAVIGAPDPNDGRQILMSLTPKCVKRLQEGRAARQDWLTTTISQKLSVHERKKLQVALELFKRLAEDCDYAGSQIDQGAIHTRYTGIRIEHPENSL